MGTKLSVLDTGVYYDAIWAYEGDTFVPDFDMYLWSWAGYEEFDRLDEVQMTTLDPDQRAEIIRQQQQVMYEDSPCIVFAHSYRLEAYRTDKWTGWQRAGYGKGPAFFASAPLIYQNIEPKTATASGGGASWTWIVVIVVAAAAAVVAILLVLRGRRRRAEEEAEEE